MFSTQVVSEYLLDFRISGTLSRAMRVTSRGRHGLQLRLTMLCRDIQQQFVSGEKNYSVTYPKSVTIEVHIPSVLEVLEISYIAYLGDSLMYLCACLE